MTWNNSILIIAGLAGVLLHTLLKYKSLNEDAKAANTLLGLAGFIKSDWLGILISILTIPVWFILFGEAAAKLTWLSSFARFSFFTMGGLGSYIVQLYFSNAKKQIRETVDVKTNKADGIKDT